VQLLAPRMVLATGLLWLWMWLTRPQRIRIDRRGLFNSVLAGLLNTLALVCFYLGLRRVDASVAILVFTIYPAILLAMLHLRGESVTRRDVVRLVLALSGVVLVADPGGSADILGVVLVLGTAFMYASYIFVLHTRLVSYPTSTTTLWIISTLGVVTPLLLPFFPSQQPLGFEGWGVVIWSAVIGTVIARLAIIEGIRLVGGGQTALLLPVETVASITMAALFLGERISFTQMAGAALVLTSVMLATVFRRRPLPQVEAGPST
jgi:drug/metabolite transporter (DMT)-like permease